jgi:arylsulfatase A-like enzyme
VEAGCRFVGVDGPGWDVHFNCFPSLAGDLIPPADRAFSALVEDLEDRGLLDETLVVMMGEMGRTPRVNAQAGRDHWSMAQTILFAGGGTNPGIVIGGTDKQAAAPTSDPVSVPDLLKTICQLLGIDSSKEYLTSLGRPIAIVDGGQVIPGLL